MKRICVFCGSSPGRSPTYADATRRLGTLLAERQLTLVYGGGNVGLMGILADAVLEAGGEVIGVIPEALVALEVAHTGLADLRVVGSMHERKALMADLADGFVALPGGLGTLEDVLDIRGREEKHLLGTTDLREAIATADADIHRNWQRYKEYFLHGRKRK